MNYEIVWLEQKTVVGLTARTNNQDPQMGMVIGGLWEQFYSGGVYASIRGKLNKKALGIYTDYAGDEKADFTVMTACEVEKTAYGEAPEDGRETSPVIKRIPAGRYARFIVKGDMRTAVAQCWQEIWKLDLPRAFVCDFEEYQDDGMEEAEIHIYIGLREEAVTAPCGTVCSGCRDYKTSCAGCNALEGKPCWISYIGKEVCPLYDCPVNERKYKTCAECAELPCQKFRELRDPGMTDEEFEKSIADRLDVLKSLAADPSQECG